MDKELLHVQIISALKSHYDIAYSAAKQAYETATHEENVAENKYDTLGLEASYLAEGQARRMAEAENALKTFERLKPKNFGEDDAIQFGTLIGLRELGTGRDEAASEVFLSPVAGGLIVDFNGRQVLLLSKLAPLGKALFGAYLEDEVELGDKRYLVESIS